MHNCKRSVEKLTMGVQQSKSATAEKAARNEQSVKSKSETAELGARKAQAVQGGREIKTQKVKLASKLNLSICK